MAMSAETIHIVKSTVPVLRSHGVEITTKMYSLLFRDNPELNQLFPDTAMQSQRLASAILAYAVNIENLDLLQGVVEKIARSHVGSQVLPEHYPIVAEALISAMKEVLGEEIVNQTVVDAWSAAYFFLADVLQNEERKLYLQENQDKGLVSVIVSGQS